jgi:quercetin dioxygenase-like cupin family protein
MHTLRIRRAARKSILGGAIAAGALAAVGVTALATAGSGFTATPSTRGALASNVRVHAGGIKVQTNGPIDVVSGQTITYIPGGFSGWHTHPGFVLAVVKSGALTITVGCSSHTYSAGQAFYETGTVPIMARNNGAQDTVVLTTYVVPPGSPVRLEANPPSCDDDDD